MIAQSSDYQEIVAKGTNVPLLVYEKLTHFLLALKVP